MTKNTRLLYTHLHHALSALIDHGIECVDSVGSPYSKERLCDLIRSDAEGVRCYLTPESEARLYRAVGSGKRPLPLPEEET